MILLALKAVQPYASRDAIDGLEAHLIGQPGNRPFADLAALCRAIPEVFDPDGAKPREDELRAGSGFKIIRRRDGLIRWIIDAHPEAAGFLMSALDARTSPRRPVVFAADGDPSHDEALYDTRTLEQRRLDALVSLARDSLKADPGDVSGTAVAVLVTIDNEALVTGVGSTIAGVEAPISAATARRLACDAKIIPVVLGGPSQVLDFGQARRLFSEAQRLAMAIRDRGASGPAARNRPVGARPPTSPRGKQADPPTSRTGPSSAASTIEDSTTTVGQIATIDDIRSLIPPAVGRCQAPAPADGSPSPSIARPSHSPVSEAGRTLRTPGGRPLYPSAFVNVHASVAVARVDGRAASRT